jgi:hypothetical protein
VAAAEADFKLQLVVQAELAAAVLVHQRPPELMEPSIQAAAVVARMEAHPHQMVIWLAQAAPASSFSSTTSALPQSSPSSHRRSGLHQRVR